MNLDKLPFNWFDLLILVVVILGAQRGRKNGMSGELTGMLRWLAIMLGCAYLYQPLGVAIAGSSTSVFSLLDGYLMAYLGVALVITFLFAMLKKATVEKMISCELFARSEFYLGMVAGVVRFACILIFGLALLNARSYSSAEIRAQVAYQVENFSWDLFPTLASMQQQVFQKSLAGPWISTNLTTLLIQSTVPEKPKHKEKELL